MINVCEKKVKSKAVRRWSMANFVPDVIFYHFGAFGKAFTF